jgi:hypothetical protein
VHPGLQTFSDPYKLGVTFLIGDTDGMPEAIQTTEWQDRGKRYLTPAEI